MATFISPVCICISNKVEKYLYNKENFWADIIQP